mmetsp:Transcript_7090/g.20175  ORF Transcript_7090/g.20175 Transcript_7090/m.20175 type:complete len:233 (-) Transcript_7090:5072-5770(-)
MQARLLRGHGGLRAILVLRRLDGAESSERAEVRRRGQLLDLPGHRRSGHVVWHNAHAAEVVRCRVAAMRWLLPGCGAQAPALHVPAAGRLRAEGVRARQDHELLDVADQLRDQSGQQALGLLPDAADGWELGIHPDRVVDRRAVQLRIRSVLYGKPPRQLLLHSGGRRHNTAPSRLGLLVHRRADCARRADLQPGEDHDLGPTSRGHIVWLQRDREERSAVHAEPADQRRPV